MEEYVLICEDSIEGILTGIYEAYVLKKDRNIVSHDNIHLVVKEPQMQNFFSEYIKIKINYEKAQKVINTIIQVCGEQVLYDLSLAMSSNDEGKADAVYHTLVLGIRHRDKFVLSRVQEEAVCKAFNYRRGVANELCHIREFVRFSELDNGMLYAKIGAKHNILPFLMPHFADRLPAENFIIYDEKYKLYGIHPKFKEWYIASGLKLSEDRIVYSQKEDEYQQLFKQFCDSIAIESRRNDKLQMNMLPLRFRPYMTEFK